MSINVNGLRAFEKKNGFSKIKSRYNPDILCLQETKCSKSDAEKIASKHGYKSYTNPNSSKKGYAGVSIFIRPELVQYVKSVKTPDLSTNQYMRGRIVDMEFETFHLLSVYVLNSGSKKSLRKEWDCLFTDYVKSLTSVVIMGDMNVCHTALDHYKWRDSIDTLPGLMQFEIDGFSKLLKDCNLIDSYRDLHPDVKSYTWFSNFNTKKLIEKNKGWRLDYALVSDDLIYRVSEVYNGYPKDDRISDHIPVVLIFKM